MNENSSNTHTTPEFDASDVSPFLPIIENTDIDRLTTFGNSIGKLYTNFQSNIYLCVAAVLSITGGILFGYDLGIISGAILQLTTEFCLGVSKSEVVVSSLVAGAIVGSLTGGFLVDFLGRKVSIVLDSLIFCVGSLILILSDNFWMLVVGRLIIGYGVSLCATAECVYVSEIAPSEKRGMLVSLNETGICIGILVAYCVSFIFVDVPEGWRYMFALSVIPAVIQGIGTLFLPRTPRYLLLRGKSELALHTLQKIRGKGIRVTSEYKEMRTAILEEQRYHWWDLFRLKDCMLQRMLIGCMVVFFQQLSGQNSLLYYTPTLLKVLGFPSNQAATLATIGVGANKFIFSIITLFAIDKIGRRPLLLTGITLLAVSMFALGSLSVAFIDPHLVLTTSPAVQLPNCSTLLNQPEYFLPSNLSLSAQENALFVYTKWMSLILLMLYVAAYQICFGSIGWVLLTELFPPSVRGQAVSLCTAVNWIMNFVITVSLLSVYHLLLGYMYIMYGIFCVIALFCVFFMVPETKGKSLERLSSELKKRKLLCLDNCNFS